MARQQYSENTVTNADNLTPWKEGQSGNPSGKPKGALSRATVLKRYLAANLKDNPSDIPFDLEGKISVEEAIALALIKKALSGDIAAIKEIQDTIHGKITDTSEIAHSYTQMGQVTVGTAPLTFNVGSDPQNFSA